MFRLKREVSRLHAQVELLEEENSRLKKLISSYIESTDKINVHYTLTESDFMRHHQPATRKKVARGRMAESLSYKIMKLYDVDEVLSDGVTEGYSLTIEARKV